MSETFKVGTNIPRAVGETFRAYPVTGGAAVLVKVVQVILAGGVVTAVIVKLAGG